MKKIEVTILCAALLGGAWTQSAARAAEPSEALKLAQQLNQAFVEVAETVSESVVIVRVASKQRSQGVFGDPFGNSPFFDQLPREFRDYLEKQQREREEEPEPRSRPRSTGKKTSTTS